MPTDPEPDLTPRPREKVRETKASSKPQEEPGFLGKGTNWIKGLAEASWLATLVTIIGTLATLLISLHVIEPGKGYGTCYLKPSTPANVQTAIAHLQLGLQYDSRKQYAFAERELSELLKIDPYFVGANLDLGYAYLEQGNLEKAEESFNLELKSVECLSTISGWNLSTFAYMLNSDTDVVNGGQKSKGLKPRVEAAGLAAMDLFSGGQKVKSYRRRLASLEDAVHYDLACLRMKQQDPDGAIAELNLAAKHCSIHPKTMEDDEDLNPLLTTRKKDFSDVLNKCPQGDP